MKGLREIDQSREPAHVRVALRQVLSHVWLTRCRPSDGIVTRPGFLTAVRLYATALRHPAATPRLRQRLLDHALTCVVVVRRREAATA